MWIILNILLYLFSVLHFLSTPRFQGEQLKHYALQWSYLIVGLNLSWWVLFTFLGQPLLQLEWFPAFSSLLLLIPSVNFFNLDALAAPLIVLSTLLIPLSLLASWKSIKFLIREFICCLFTINILLILAFSTLDLIWFYIFFEGILIPMFIIIGVWGARQDKIAAAFYFFFFTLLGSFLFLIGIFTLYFNTGTTNFIVLQTLHINPSLQNWLFIAFVLSFAVKLPQFPFHIWLPQAHVEAPVAGSVILAGILLKLGGYGYMRFCLPLFPEASNFFSPLMCLLGALAILWGSINTLRQADMKRLVAYSSVAHMGLVTLALFSGTPEGQVGALLVMVAHGFVSPALFIAVTFLYDRFHTRLIRYYRGLAYAAPLFSFCFVVLSLMNMGLPPTGNFVAEFMCLLAIFQTSPWSSFLGGLGVIFAAAYALWFCNRLCFGSFSPHLITLRDISRRESLLVLPLILLPFILGVYPQLICQPLINMLSTSPILL